MGGCFPFGGDGGSRTRVQKYFQKASPSADILLRFPSPFAEYQANGYGSAKAVAKGGTTLYSRSPLIDALAPPRYSGVGRLLKIKQQEQLYCCRLFFKSTDVKAVPHRYSLPFLQRSCRNLYIPMF